MAMPVSVPHVVLVAKQLEIEELKRLKARSHLVGAIGHMIHVLQSERGASSIYLASAGKRFAATRQKLIAEAESIEQGLREQIAGELEHSNAKIISLLAWVLFGLDALPKLRKRITEQRLDGSESVAAFSRLIAGMISLIFELADAAVDPEISRLLVSLFNLIEGKELAGQERAVGSLAFGSGQCPAALQQRISYLIDAQERSFRTFLEFAEAPLPAIWHKMEGELFVTRLQGLRLLLTTAKPNASLDPNLSNTWFDCCSERISYMWTIQRDLVAALERRCDALIAAAQRELQNTEGLLKTLQNKPPARVGIIDRFFDPELPIERSLSFRSGDLESQHRAHSIIELLQAQSLHLSKIENELTLAKRTLNDRKTIERAKGILMANYNLKEDEAYKKMRSTAMEQNRRLVRVAEDILSVSAKP